MTASSQLARFRDPELLLPLVERLRRQDPGRELCFMHVCGTHENAIARHGLRSLLPSWLRIIAGPGCPVCVCPPQDIAMAARLSLERPDVILATYGDMVNVPGDPSLAEARARGGDVRVVQGAGEAVELAAALPGRQVVMLAVGFETTACTVAAALLADPPDSFSVISSHRLIPPALEALLQIDDLRTDGFLLPGHVLTVAGLDPYEPIAASCGRPMVTGGFEPLDIVFGLSRLVALRDRGGTDNAYRRAARAAGNPRAVAAMDQAFEVCDASWRGLGVIPRSGLGLSPALRRHDAVARFGLTPDPSLADSLPGCRCGEVMVGLVEPEACALFGTVCTPDAPHGPCMVSFEGTCRNRFLYREAS